MPGSDHEDVLWGVEFLAAVAKGHAPELKDRVLVIGGGNVAIDVSLSALRCKVKDVTMICLESKGEMPASPWEIEDTIHEGVIIEPSWGPEEIIIEIMPSPACVLSNVPQCLMLKVLFVRFSAMKKWNAKVIRL